MIDIRVLINGRSQPSLTRLKDIAKGLDSSVSFLLGEWPEEEASLTALLRDFSSWPEEDLEELLVYLKAKRMARQDSPSLRHII